jgi:hypothetical protein
MKTNIIGSVINTNVIGDIKSNRSPAPPEEGEVEQPIINNKILESDKETTENQGKINRSYWNL